MNVIPHVVCEATSVSTLLDHSMPEEPTRKCYNRARAIFQLNSKGWDIKEAILIFTNSGE